MSNATNLLAKLAAVDDEISRKKATRSALLYEIEMEVLAAGPIEAHGYRAHYKAGRKSTNHEKAATENSAPEELVLKYTNTKITTTTEWAKVTKDMGINLTPYTTQGEPSFVVEKVN